MSSNDHDTLVYRLAQILVKLNQGEKLDPRGLAEEFGVNLRTIQRDLNIRFSYLPLQKSGGKYQLDPAYLGKLSTKDIERFAGLAGVSRLFPSLSNEFLRDIFDSRMQSTFLVKGHYYEDLSEKTELFRDIENAIISRNHVSFEYEKQEGRKFYSSVAPYKLINNKGIWYLAVTDTNKLKIFSFSKIDKLIILDSVYTPDPEVESQLDVEDGVWISSEKLEIVMKVSGEVAEYFKRRRLIANQVIEKQLEDGSLIISAKVGHANQVLPVVRYWIPHIRIINPLHLQKELEEDLADYLKMS